jgi:hypothetical protein
LSEARQSDPGREIAPDAPATAEEQQDAYALALLLEEGVPADPSHRVSSSERTARMLSRAREDAAPEPDEASAARIRSRIADGLRARRARVRHRLIVVVSAAAACLALVLGVWGWMGRGPDAPHPKDYHTLFGGPFASESRALERIERIALWRRGSK